MINKFIKENIVLFIGILLPILMITIFGLASILPSYFVPAPQYQLLYYTGGDNYYNKGIKIIIHQGKISLYAYCTQSCSEKIATVNPGITFYIFNGSTRQAKEIKVAVPPIPEDAKPYEKEIVVPELNALTVDAHNPAPDGYTFSTASYRSGGLFTEIFYDNRSTQASIHKDGVHIKLNPETRSYYWNEIKFVGWIVPGKDK